MANESVDPMNIVAEKNSESYKLAAEDDDGEGRIMYGISACIAAADCSKSSWDGHYPWSLVSHQHCLCYLKWHLMKSGKHMFPEEQADDVIQQAFFNNEIDFTETTDTFKDREWYRNQLTGIANSKQAAATGNKAAKRPRGSAGSHDAAPSHDQGHEIMVAPPIDFNDRVAYAVAAAMRRQELLMILL
jgi:hypothetical protein